MAHPKLKKLVGSSVLTISTAALFAGPLAGMATAQVDLGTETEKILVDGEWVDAVLVDGVWVDPITLEPIQGVEETTQETTKKTTETVDKTVKETTETTDSAPSTDPVPEVDDGSTTDGGGGETVIPDDGPKKSAGDGPTVISEPSGGAKTTTSTPTRVETPHQQPARKAPPEPARHYMAASGEIDFNPGASPWSGFGSMSSLTLQPFDEPIAAPGAYGLPGAAADLFLPEAAAAATTATSATAASTAPASTSATAPPAWLLATSTGLLMLVGAGHFVRMTTRNLNIDE